MWNVVLAITGGARCRPTWAVAPPCRKKKPQVRIKKSKYKLHGPRAPSRFPLGGWHFSSSLPGNSIAHSLFSAKLQGSKPFSVRASVRPCRRRIVALSLSTQQSPPRARCQFKHPGAIQVRHALISLLLILIRFCSVR